MGTMIVLPNVELMDRRKKVLHADSRNFHVDYSFKNMSREQFRTYISGVSAMLKATGSTEIYACAQNSVSVTFVCLCFSCSCEKNKIYQIYLFMVSKL
jgi:hypothetical protein